MADEYKQSPRIENVHGNAIYNFHEAPPRKPFRPGLWGWASGITAALALAGTVATTQLSTKVYYCASYRNVKYHTDATCLGLKQCGSTVKSMSLSKARSKMEPCKMCH
jgi:hypothetical protein